MKVLLVDTDSQKDFPNLALMKISTWHKTQGDDVELIKGVPDTAPLNHYDKTYISCIFYQSKEKVLEYANLIDNVILGGSGIDLTTELQHDIEHIMPDYTLYGNDFSVGFTSRGCIRNCGFCVVPTKEGRIRDNASILEFLHPDHKKVILLDNNFQASPRWRENINIIIERNLKVNFNQGLDIRILNEEFADYLAKTKYYDWKFKRRSVYFAFDRMSTEGNFRRGMGILEDAGINPRNIMVYILVGFDTTIEEDIKRFDIIRSYGADPYVMRFNQTVGPNRILLHFARWVNARIYKVTSFDKYDNSDSLESYHKTFEKVIE